jgi:NAD(P)-dependent dehydrogenase (short-subunit alcohol dehydrogenase family)
VAAIVTGGSSGIGLAIASRLGRAGESVLLVARDLAKLEQAQHTLRSDGMDVATMTVDISEPASSTVITRRCLDEFGRVDTLVNSAGTFEVVDTGALSLDHWERTITTNLTAAAFLSRDCAAVMQPGGRIVNIASINAVVSEPMSAAYSASKAGLVSLTRSLAVDLGPKGIMVNCVAPGWVRTPMIEEYLESLEPEFLRRLNPLGRIGEPAEIAEVVAFLARSDVTYLSGQTIFVDGGQTSMAAFP